jgi:hypothetical protein
VAVVVEEKIKANLLVVLELFVSYGPETLVASHQLVQEHHNA